MGKNIPEIVIPVIQITNSSGNNVWRLDENGVKNLQGATDFPIEGDITLGTRFAPGGVDAGDTTTDVLLKFVNNLGNEEDLLKVNRTASGDKLVFGSYSGGQVDSFAINLNNSQNEFFMNNAGKAVLFNDVTVGLGALTINANNGVSTVAQHLHLFNSAGGNGATTEILFGGAATNSAKGAIIYENNGSGSYRGYLHFCSNLVADTSNATIADARLTIDPQGFVGIGIKDPAYRLHVEGNARISGTSDPTLYIAENNSFTDYLRIQHTSATQTRITSFTASGVSYLDLGATPSDGISGANVRLFRETNTTGAVALELKKGDGTNNNAVIIGANTDTIFNIGLADIDFTINGLSGIAYKFDTALNRHGWGQAPSTDFHFFKSGNPTFTFEGTGSQTLELKNATQTFAVNVGGSGNIALRNDGNTFLTVQTSATKEAIYIDNNALIINNNNALLNFIVKKNTSGDAINFNATTDDVTFGSRVIFPASTTSKSSVHFTQGVAPTSPAKGNLWFENNHLAFITESDKRILTLGNGTITSDTTVTNTTVETTVYSEPISANEFHVGQCIKLLLTGRFSTASGSDLFTLRVKIGGTTVSTLSSQAANVTNGAIRTESILTVRTIGATGTIKPISFGRFNKVNNNAVTTGTVTVDTTTNNNLTVTIQWASASAGNTATISQANVEYIG